LIQHCFLHLLVLHHQQTTSLALTSWLVPSHSMTLLIKLLLLTIKLTLLSPTVFVLPQMVSKLNSDQLAPATMASSSRTEH
jgi:hypothetical protein